jgi:hypothetical protein
MANWGATAEETRQVMASDGVLPDPRWRATKAISISVPPAKVWPWVAQIGQGRAGWYSNDRVVNLLNSAKISSADRIHPEWQDVKVGDPVDATNQIFLRVQMVEPNAILAMGADQRNSVGQPWSTCWSLVLQPEGTDGTRLLWREASDWSSLFVGILMNTSDPFRSYLVIRSLKGIKQRAEAAG